MSDKTAIELELQARLKDAMRARDDAGKAAIRMVRTKIMEARTQKAGVVLSDDDIRGIVAKYVKQLEQGIDELGGDEDDANVAQMKAEVAFLAPFLPQLMDEAATERLVGETIEALGVTDPKMTGRVIGAVMKDHKGKVDAGLVARLVKARLAG